MLNTAELRRAMDLVLEANAAGLHDQVEWIRRFDCGTGGCFAGTYALDMGCVPVWYKDYETTNTIRDPRSGAQWDVSDWAQLALGLTEAQAVALFAANNTLSDLKEYVDQFCESTAG